MCPSYTCQNVHTNGLRNQEADGSWLGEKKCIKEETGVGEGA